MSSTTWQYGSCRDIVCEVMTGDCLKFMCGMNDACIDSCIVDPPYLVNYRGARGTKQRIANDTPSSGSDWVRPFYADLYRLLKNNSLSVTFYGWPHMDTFLQGIREAGFHVVSQLVFVKNQMGLGYYTRGKHEQALLLAKGSPPYPRPAPPDVFPFTRVRKARHPNEKPLDSLCPLVELTSRPGDLIFDPYCGSGAVGEAALSLDRRFLGIELDPKHALGAKERLERFLDADCTRKSCRTLAHPGTV